MKPEEIKKHVIELAKKGHPNFWVAANGTCGYERGWDRVTIETYSDGSVNLFELHKCGTPDGRETYIIEKAIAEALAG